MRLVLDTNVLIAAAISRGQCHELLEHCAKSHTLVTSTFLLGEFRTKLVEKFRIPEGRADAATALLASRMESVTPATLERPVCRDRDDDHVLGTALAGDCACIVTGDKDLLVLGEYNGVRILQPSAFWRYETSWKNQA